MFSEYASRFLAQSQSRLSLGQQDLNESRSPLDRRRGGGLRGSQRGYLQRQPGGGPYQGSASQLSRLPFASRFAQAQPPAPLFYSATDEFREEDDGEEHEREVADMYALQQSRRDFGATRLSESSELEDEEEGPSQEEDSPKPYEIRQTQSPRRTGGIRSSWLGDERAGKPKQPDSYQDYTKDKSEDESEASAPLSRTRDRLVDVELASTVHGSVDMIDQRDALIDNPPSVQRLPRMPMLQSRLDAIPQGPEEEPGHARPQSTSPDIYGVPATFISDPPDAVRHDAFWSSSYLLCLASMFSSFILVALHTSAPSSSNPLGDTIYTTLHSSFYLLAVDTLVAVIVALLWLFTLRSFVRPLVLGILVAVPVILFSFTLYPFISSFKGSWHGHSIQDKIMRWFAFVPGVVGILWVYTVYKGRQSFGRAIELLEFACRILSANPGLVIVGFTTLAAVVVFTWTWMLMFTRVFLGGTITSNKNLFVIDTGTWWLAIFFVWTYLWTLGVLSGLQRATTAATVSQWYFHRLAIPAPSSQRIVLASISHATTTVFGSICLASLLSLAIRLPLLIVPRRIAGYISLCFYSLVPTSIATLTNPLTITYAAIHSHPVASSARGLSEMSFISRTFPTTTLTPQQFSSNTTSGSQGGPALLPYRFAKLLLHSTRLLTSLAFGFGGWVSTARMVSVAGSSMRGSAYAYVVGLIAGAIGWAVLGAMEGVLGGILDAVVVCWGSEVGARGLGQVRYCREAGELLKDDGSVSL